MASGAWWPMAINLCCEISPTVLIRISFESNVDVLRSSSLGCYHLLSGHYIPWSSQPITESLDGKVGFVMGKVYWPAAHLTFQIRAFTHENFGLLSCLISVIALSSFLDHGLYRKHDLLLRVEHVRGDSER
jgi:hypothetical protein